MVAEPDATKGFNPSIARSPDEIFPVIPRSLVRSFLSTVKLSKDADEEARTDFSRISNLERIDGGITGRELETEKVRKKEMLKELLFYLLVQSLGIDYYLEE